MLLVCLLPQAFHRPQVYREFGGASERRFIAAVRCCSGAGKEKKSTLLCILATDYGAQELAVMFFSPTGLEPMP